MAEGGPNLKNELGTDKIQMFIYLLGNPLVHGELKYDKTDF